MSNRDKEPKIEIQLPEDIAVGNYANLVSVAHSSSEFVMDFISLLPGMDRAKVNSRVILAPEHAKRLLFTLRDNIVRYEQECGEIVLEEMQLPPIGNVRGEA
ncbi:DUF3467 domain-containing protein [Bacteroides propionicifaciens]|jgi:hypothetical protein|uniref:DUF3467 domain-containing protein n=1 Tax=Bacteroides propionicifaciens TaxID=392838 RepID=UPI00036112C0|nr:DUF3467 domain-containing protein [Bacteroides propionicifaciens]